MDPLRKELQDLRSQKRVTFHELERLILRIVHAHEKSFSTFKIKQHSSRVVFHFHVPDLDPITLEREHQGRDCVLPKFAKIVMNQIEELLVYIEGHQ